MMTQSNCLRRMPEMVNVNGKYWEPSPLADCVIPTDIFIYVLQANTECATDSSTTSVCNTFPVSAIDILLMGLHDGCELPITTKQAPTLPKRKEATEEQATRGAERTEGELSHAARAPRASKRSKQKVGEMPKKTG